MYSHRRGTIHSHCFSLQTLYSSAYLPKYMALESGASGSLDQTTCVLVEEMCTVCLKDGVGDI